MAVGYKLNLEGRQFNGWKVINFEFVKKRKRYFKCICVKCGINKIIMGTYLNKYKASRCICSPQYGNKKNTLKEGFEKFVIKNSDGCWGWSGCAPKNPGYGQFRVNKELIRSHRASWILHHGPIPEGMQVLHKCDNRICTNPNHLFLGTNKDNIQDMLSKNRHPTMGKSGEANHRALITRELADKIRDASRKQKSIINVAKMFNVSRAIVVDIKYGNTWKVR